MFWAVLAAQGQCPCWIFWPSCEAVWDALLSWVALLPGCPWIFVITEIPNFTWLCSHTGLHLLWQLHVEEKILEERSQNHRSLDLHPFPAQPVTGQAWLSSALALRLWPSLAKVSLFPAAMSSHTENFPWWGAAGRNGPAFPALQPGGLWTHPSHPTVFHLFTGARNSSELTIPPGPVSHPLLVTAPPGW